MIYFLKVNLGSVVKLKQTMRYTKGHERKGLWLKNYGNKQKRGSTMKEKCGLFELL